MSMVLRTMLFFFSFFFFLSFFPILFPFDGKSEGLCGLPSFVCLVFNPWISRWGLSNVMSYADMGIKAL